MSIRIVHLVPRLEEGGVERTVLELNEGMAARGHESIVVSLGGRLEDKVAAAGGTLVRFDVAGKNPVSLLPRAVALRRKLDRMRPGIVHVHSRLPAWLIRIGGKPAGGAAVSTVHGFSHVSLYSKAMTAADHVTVPCTALREHLVQSYGTPAGLISVIPWGIDLRLCERASADSAGRAAIRNRFPKPGRILVASAGRLTRRKGHDLFIAALAKAIGLGCDLYGAVVGGTEDTRTYQRELERQARDSGLGEDRLRFLDATDDILGVLAAMDVVVVASSKPEGFGRIALEAVAMDRPVVAARHGGVLDIIENRRNGLLFAPGDVTDLAEKLAEAARTRWGRLRASIERFDAGRTLDLMEEVYRKTAGG